MEHCVGSSAVGTEIPGEIFPRTGHSCNCSHSHIVLARLTLAPMNAPSMPGCVPPRRVVRLGAPGSTCRAGLRALVVCGPARCASVPCLPPSRARRGEAPQVPGLTRLRSGETNWTHDSIASAVDCLSSCLLQDLCMSPVTLRDGLVRTRLADRSHRVVLCGIAHRA